MGELSIEALKIEEGIINFFDCGEERGLIVGGGFFHLSFGLVDHGFAKAKLEDGNVETWADVEKFAVLFEKVVGVQTGVAAIAEEGKLWEKINFANADLGGC